LEKTCAGVSETTINTAEELEKLSESFATSASKRCREQYDTYRLESAPMLKGP